MVERTEQEQLASLVGGEDLEPIDTGNILAAGLKASLGNPSAAQIPTINEEIEKEENVPISPIKRLGQKGQNQPSQRIAASEKLILTLYDIRDNLIEAFGGCKLNSGTAVTLANEINRLGSCIVNLGGEAETFDPLSHVSGLEVPNIMKNAEEVIERTMQCYKLGVIKEAKIKDDGKEINIVFEGQDGSTMYRAAGRIIAKVWTGNEAIDYVYTPKSGKMSVKAFEGGKWVNKNTNDNDDYDVCWELSEQDLSQNSAETSSSKEEVPQNAQNNTTENVEADGDEDIGSPIR